MPRLPSGAMPHLPCFISCRHCHPQVWIIGEYAERIDNADELLETFLDTFPEENSMVGGDPPVREIR